MKRVLVESDSDSEIKLSINNDYAKRYNTWREKEELQKREFYHFDLQILRFIVTDGKF